MDEGSPNPDLPLVEFFVNEYPQHIQKILLCLAVDVNEAAPLQDRLFALHRYAFFADIVVSCNPREMAQFVLRDITHTLIFVVKKSSSNKEKVLAASACHFLRRFLGKCLPRHVSILENFINLIVGILTPLAVLQDNLGTEALKCIKLLIVDNKECLLTAIGGLNPFPNSDVFEEVQLVYQTTIKRDSRCTLEDHIKHFLDASAGRLGSKAEGLLHIRSKLSDRKAELQVMYHELKDSRGFSEDCANSLLHQLVCKLVELTSDSDIRIRLEASRCLGELGPADLGSMVLKPEATQERVSDPFRAITSLAISLLVDYLVHEDIVVVQSASAALYALLATKHGQHATDRNDSKFVIPFKSMEAVGIANPRIVVDLDIFKQLIGTASLWCPSDDCSHEKWITDLVSSLLQTFPENCYLHHLIPVCQAKVSFSEKILPLLVELILCNGGEECVSIISQCMRYFFSKLFATSQLDSKLSVSPVEELKHSKEQICCNRASVQCMLDVVHFIRLQRSPILKMDGTRQLYDNGTHLDLDYLHVARAAQFCLAYFTSILYAELWCEEIHLKKGTSKHLARQNQTLSKLDNISNMDLEGGLAIQNLLREAYIRIGDSDAVYGCGSSHLLNPQTRVRHYEMLGKWDDVLLLYDIELTSGNSNATRGMLFALERFGLHHLQHGYQETLDDSSGDSVNYECLWRLGLWNTPVESDDQTANALKDVDHAMSHGEYSKYHYLSLKALNNKDTTGLENAVSNARQCVIESLANVSLESSKNLYPALSQLQSLQEIEDFAASAQSGSFESVFDKWKCQDQLNIDEFSYIEPIFAQRAAMLNIMLEMDIPAQNNLAEMLVQIQLMTVTRARLDKCHQVAMRCLGKLNKNANLPTDIISRIKLEEACLAWEHGNEEVARVLLQSLLSKYSKTPPTSEPEITLYSLALQKYGNWMVETKSENPQVIIECYLLKSLSLLRDSDNAVDDRIETYGSLARFADAQYQQISRYVKSAETQKKRQACTDALNNKEVDDSSKASKLLREMSKIDRKEIENAEKDRTTFLLQAIEYYVLSLKQGSKDKENMLVFRLVSLWLENPCHEELNEILDRCLDMIPSYKFLSVLPQLAPRMGNNPNDDFVIRINNLLERCAIDHPHHTLPLILALANSLRDQQYLSKSNNNNNSNKRRPEPRVLGAQEMVKSLRKNHKIGTIVQQMQILAEALIELANYSTDKCKAGAFPFPKECKLHKLKNLTSVLVPTITLGIRQNRVYNDIVGVQGFENSFELVGGVNAPKKIVCRCTDGIRRPQLVKGKDDLRQDAVMQQVFTMMNTVLKNNKETQKRKLIIRTYKVVPLSQCSGILEWCQNTEPIGAYLVGPKGRTGAHSHYFPDDLTNAECRTLTMDASKGTNERKLKVFQDICSRLHPVFHYFFLENFPTPGLWFERRLAFIHSVATTSMIGYILGLGDRHVNNILIDKITAEVVHIDFGIAFEQGKVLPLPETVPFRLTRDIEDGMGVSGVEGVFRRSCEKTMSVLRQNQETILTILEVLLYDPLYDWTITPEKAYKMQQEKRSKNGNTVDAENSTIEVNKLAERALQRLRQKLQGTEEGTAMSVAGQVNWLIQQARDPGNLSKVYFGWQAHL